MARNVNITAETDKGITLHKNVRQHLFIIYEDKIRLALMDFVNSNAKDADWKSPLSVLVTLIIAILTADFKDFPFASSDTIRAMAYMATVYFGCQTIKKGLIAYRMKKKSIDDIIAELRESSQEDGKKEEPC